MSPGAKAAASMTTSISPHTRCFSNVFESVASELLVSSELDMYVRKIKTGLETTQLEIITIPGRWTCASTVCFTRPKLSSIEVTVDCKKIKNMVLYLIKDLHWEQQMQT